MNGFMHFEHTDTFITCSGYSVSEVKRILKETEGGFNQTPVGFGV